jgi:gliding motility-associated-like protein
VDPDGTGPKAPTTSNYTFQWWKGGTVKTTAPDYTGPVLTGLVSGQYVVLVTSTDGCQAQEIYTIDPPSVYPTAVLTPTNDNSCDPSLPNGQMVAVASGTGPFTYQWYTGSGTSTIISGATSNTITGLRNNTYTVKVTDTSTGCFVIEEAKVEPGIPPTVTVSATPSNATCFNMDGSYNGSITASVGGPTTGYTYKWYIGDQVKVTPDYTGSNVYSGLKPGEYTVAATNDATHCLSDPVTVTVGQTLSFDVNIIKTGTLSGCIASGAKLTAVPTVAGTYSYSWYNGDPDLTAYPFYSASRLLPNGNLDHYDIILPKKYTVVVTNTVTGCYLIKAEDLTGASNIPALKLKVVNNTSCDPAKPNGKVEIEYIWPNSQDLTTKVYPVAGKFPGYEVDWIEGATESTPVSLTNDSATYSLKKAGTYGVKVRISSDPNDCPSAFTPAKIINVFDYPVLSPAVVTHKTNCPPSSDPTVKPNGKIEVTITNYTGNAADYGYTVVKSGDPSFVPTATLSNKLTINNLDLGTYTITIFKVSSTCAMARVATISDAHITPTAPLLRVNNTNCKTLLVDYNGKIEDVTPNLVQYKYLWFRSSDNVQIGDLTGNTPYIDALAPGKYYLLLVDRITYCSSSIIEREVVNMNVVPYISQSGSTDRTYCAPVFDGTATVTLGPKIWSGYTLKWFDRLGNPVTVTTAHISNNKFVAQNLDSGTYTLEAYDGLNGCSNATQIKVGLDQTLPEVSLTTTPNTMCIPLTGTLTATYSASNANPVVGYIWKKVENGIVVPMAATTANVGPVEQGDYLVSAIDSKGCESTPVQRAVIDNTPKPQINLVNLRPQSSCDETTKANGLIQITTKPYGKTYSYSWFKDGSPFAASTDTLLTALKKGQYVVEVTTDGCVFKDTFNIQYKKASFVPVVAKQNVTRCVYPYDGFLAASVDGSTNGYTFQWNYLDSAKVYNTAEIASLPQGAYSLKVTNTTTSCDTTLLVNIGFDAKPFDIQITELEPVSNCDFVNKPNGKMVASVDGEISGYRFDWYETSNVTASSSVKFSGNAQNTLMPVTYTLRVTNLITGCAKDQLVTPTFLPVSVAAPLLDSVKGVTSCIKGNGYAEVSAGGSNANHIFNWYIGTEIKDVPDFTGYYQENLEIGEYLVTATDRFSGCTSGAIRVSIGDEKVFVDIKAITTNSLCYNNTGTATITWIEPVGVDKIQLVGESGVLDGDSYSELPVGEFEVTLETVEGCVSKKTIKIGADYLVYNGVSPNGDQKNDFLAIDCIELFPNNNVKIFNRAGALVYVGEGYDNERIRFEGQGNRGMYVSSNHVPDGTYFYVVDPGDGRKPKAGFFELIR